MTEEAKTILNTIEKYLKDNPDIRFTQALFNLDINEFLDKQLPLGFRDNYNDTDEKVLKRIKSLNL